jgi:hypothetical protein
MLACIDYHFVPTDRYFDSFFAEYVPKFLDESLDSILHVDGHVWLQFEICVKLVYVLVRTVNVIEVRIWRCKS